MTTNPTAESGQLRGVFDQVFTAHDFALESGRILPELRIAYETYGRLAPDQRNAVLLTHGYTSNHHMVGRGGSTLAEGLWNSLVGPGKAVDTDRFFVVSSNMLGSSYGSTGPAERNPVTGRPYGPDFPDISLVDIISAQRSLLRHLDIEHLVAVVGPSYGGFRAFQWAVTFPGFMDGIVPVTTHYKSNGGAGLAALIAELEADPRWNNGRYYDNGGVLDTLTRVRVRTLISYGMREHLAASFPDPAERELEIARVARKWAGEFDANALIALGRASARFNVEEDLSRIRARVLYVLSRTDNIFPPSLAPGVMAKLREAGVRAEYVEIDSDLGHAAPGIEGAKWAPQLAAFMAQLLRRED
jgi:homoserine O-acetyltransferase/O-succinyltransferase